MLLLIPFGDGKQLPGYAAYQALKPHAQSTATEPAKPELQPAQPERTTSHVAELEKSREQQEHAAISGITLH